MRNGRITPNLEVATEAAKKDAGFSLVELRKIKVMIYLSVNCQVFAS